ncbi:DUF4355 domain-containing protein [Aneurinibacillus aneurinilyticus]|jgi:hypothetical protein|uniref:DUF4355 domain-containing protein n=1 Tax=Aneurinibacillus aneurinilyticus TaxID=1391 RepID=UPI0023F7B5CC|nr:DUF4355 domain-containing protein [Aneurinibacillus aneurinilyticus]MCI1693303.1 DUF4355 domain-containing protein [Aneurinibacillus aneurinilyticus]
MMNLEEVKQFIEESKENEEVQTYLKGLYQMSVADVEHFLKTNKEGMSWLDSTVDKRTAKSLETWKANHLEGLIDTEIKKRFPEKDARDIEVERLRAEVEKMKLEKQREVLMNQAMKAATEKNLPFTLIEYFIGVDEASTLQNLTVLEEAFQQAVQKAVEQRLKGEGYTPPQSSASNTITWQSVSSMSPDEINQNWDSIKQALKQKL